MNTIGNYNLEDTIYRNLPVTHVKSLERFLEQGIHPGDFMVRVLENNLVGAVAHADENSKSFAEVEQERLQRQLLEERDADYDSSLGTSRHAVYYSLLRI